MKRFFSILVLLTFAIPSAFSSPSPFSEEAEVRFKALENAIAAAIAGIVPFTQGETISNASDDVLIFTSNDESITLRALGFEAKSAVLQLWSDEGDDAADKYSFTVDTSDVLTLASGGAMDYRVQSAEATDAKITLQTDDSDDNGDDWEIKNAASGNALSFSNDTSGSQVSKLALSTTGILTMSNDETLSNVTDDSLIFASNDEAAVIEILGFEAKAATLRLSADESDDTGDTFNLNVSTADVFSINSEATPLLSIATTGAMTTVGGLAGDGGDALVGFLNSAVAATATTLTVAQCGSTVRNTGAVAINLPDGAAGVIGCRFTFVTGNASNFDVNPGNSDLILLLTNAAGDAIRNATLGNSVTLEYTGTNQWNQISIIGTWSDIN